MPGIVTVLLSDWMHGQPIEGANVWLYGHDSQVIAKGVSDDAGRCPLVMSEQAHGMSCRLVADVDHYFAGLGIECGYSDVSLTFRAHAAEILLTLAPFGYLAHIGRLRSGRANFHAQVSDGLSWRIEEDAPFYRGKCDATSNGWDVMSREWDERFESLVRDHLPFLAADEELTPDLDLREFGLDSLKAVELLIALESLYDVRLTSEAVSMHTFATPGALWTALHAKGSATELSVRN